MTTPAEYPLANIVRVDIVTEETSPVSYTLTDVATTAEVTAYISTGAQEALRVKNTIKAQNNFEDIVMGYDVRLVQATMIPEILALIDGGEWNDTTETYTGAQIGSPVSRTPFTMKIYTEEKDADGSTAGYTEFDFAHCKGQPVNFNFQDGQFYTPEMTLRSRPALGESPVTFKLLETLPA